MVSEEVEGSNLLPFSISFGTQCSNGYNNSVRLVIFNIVESDNVEF